MITILRLCNGLGLRLRLRLRLGLGLELGFVANQPLTVIISTTPCSKPKLIITSSGLGIGLRLRLGLGSGLG